MPDEANPSVTPGRTSDPNPQVILDPKLRDYLDRKGASAVVVDLASCKTCGGAISEVFARAAKPDEVARLKEKPHRTVASDGVEILIVNRFVRIGDQVELGLRTFLGVKDITIKGLEF